MRPPNGTPLTKAQIRDAAFTLGLYARGLENETEANLKAEYDLLKSLSDALYASLRKPKQKRPA